MFTSLARRGTRRVLRELVILRAQTYENWSSPALIFAPHPDDETLGCGGTIVKKLRHGAPVHVAFMTDGTRSHEGRISPERLRNLRTREAEAACNELGLVSANLTFFEIEDGTLEQHARAAGAKVRALLERYRPEEVFVPYHADNQPDHIATTQIVRNALSSVGSEVQVFEYPIWLWHHWPWVRLGRNPKTIGAVLRATIHARHRLFRELRWVADVREALAIKHAALKRHGSQMERFGGDASWPILADVANGDWLECFFSGYELFHGYAICGSTRRAEHYCQEVLAGADHDPLE